MVAIVSGNGLGLLTGSAGVLGKNGVFGNSILGNNREAAYINVASGNVVLQDSDDFLAAHGVNTAFTRTYNSQGSFSDGSGAWKYGLVKQITSLTGTVNTNGSTVSRLAGDGSSFLFTWNAAKAAYTSTDGGGATQSLTYNATSHEWTWRADSFNTAGVCEIYGDLAANNGRILRTEEYNTTGSNAVVLQKFYYNAAGRLSQVTDSAGTAGVAGDNANNLNDQTYFDYDTNGNLSQIRTVLAGTSGAAVQSMVRTSYGYDAQNRLTSVTVDLSTVNVDPLTGALQLTAANSNTSDGKVYTTVYGYDGDSNRISSVLQSDGTQLNFNYKQYGASWKLDSYTDALGRKTSFDYSVANKASVTDALGLKTTYGYDAQGQLTDVTAPAVNGASQIARFTYDAKGNLATATDARGLVTTYGYDANNNRTLEVDSTGRTIKRTYDLTSNKLLAEARYVVADSDGAGAAVASDAARTSYVYDTFNRLRYVIDADFRLTEYRYNSTGELASEIHYPEKFWPAAGFTDLTTLPESNINTALAGATFDKTKTVRTDYTYDARGLVRSSTRYANVDASGNGKLDGQQSVTTYIYDQAGQLLYSRDGNNNLSTNVYDGLGRLISVTDASGTVTSSVYDNRANLTVSTTAQGAANATATISYIHDSAGQIVSVQKQFANAPSGITRNAYDQDGQLRMSTAADGQKTYWLYDDAGRKVAQIEASGILTEYSYNANNQVVKTTRYVTPVNTASLVDAQGQPTSIALDTLRPQTPLSGDLSTWNGYDLGGRLVATVDGNGFLTRMVYDGLNRLSATISRAKPVDISKLTAAAVGATVTGETSSPDDRQSYLIYDHDGHQVGSIDAMGYLTENRYDAGGRLVETIAYTTMILPANRALGNINTIRPGGLPADIHQRYIYNNKDQLVGSIDGDNFLTEISYDPAGNVSSRRRYVNAVTVPAAATLAQVGKTVHADDRVTSYTYNALNQLDTQTDPAGSFAQYRYDVNGKVLTVTRGTSGVAERTSTVRYDGAGRLIGELSMEGAARLALLGATPDASAVDQIWALYALRYTYSANGLRTSMTDVQGNRTLYFYDSLGRLASTVSGAGDVQEQRYNIAGQVIKTIQYAKRLDATTLAKLSGGQNDAAFTALTLAGSGDVATEQYYDNGGRLRYVVDGSGQILENSYNAYGQVVQTISYSSKVSGAALAALTGGDAATANLSSYLGSAYQRSVNYYNANGQLLYTVNALGEVRGQTYDALGQVSTVTTYGARAAAPATLTGAASEIATFAVANAGNSVQTYLYNHRGGVVDLSINGNHTLTGYNSFGQVNKVTRLFTANSTASLATADQITQTIYDGNGRVQASIDGTGTVTAYQYDGDGHVTDQLRYANALAGYANAADIVKTYRDALAANTLSDPLRDQHQRFIYDGDGSLCITLTAQTTVAGKNGQNQTTYAVKWDVVRQTRDSARRVVTRTAYAMRMDSSLAPSTDEVLRWMASADLRSVNDSTPVNGVPADGGAVSDAIVRYVYDGANRLAATATAQHRDGNNVLQWSVVRQDYDTRGNVTVRTQLATLLTDMQPSDAAILAVPLSAGADAVARYNYDGANRMTVSAVAQGPTAASANPPSTQQWAVTRLSYDSFGNLSSRVQYATLAKTNTPADDLSTLVSANAALDRSTSYRYDGSNRLAVSIDASGAITRIDYDDRGNASRTIAYAVKTTTPELVGADYAPALTASDRVTRTVYDLLHRPVYEIDTLGQVTEHTYDTLGNLTSNIRYATPLTSAKLAILAAGGDNLSVADVKGQLTAASLTLDRIERFAYDQDGQLRYTVDAAGYLKETIYNALGQVAETRAYLQLPPAALSAAPTLTELANEATRQYKAGYASTNLFSYDVRGNLLTSTDPQSYTESWQYDGLGNKISYTNKAGSTWTYHYDAAGHMVEEDSPLVAAYSADFSVAMGKWGAGVSRALVTLIEYDALGNLIKRTEASNTASQRITRYRYDNLGRQTQTILQAADIYDDAGDPKTATGTAVRQEKNSGERITSVSYNAFGDAVSNTDVNGQVSYKVYDQRGQLAYDIDALGYVTSYTRDTFGNQTVLKRYADPLLPFSGADLLQQSTAEFARHILGNVPEDRTIRTAYDLLGRVIKVSTPLTAVFDQQSNMISPYLTAGKTTDTFYTTFGEVRQQTVYGATADGLRVTDGSDSLFYYDARGNKTTQIDVLSSDAGGHSGMGYVTSYVYGFDTASKASTVTRTEFATLDAWDDRVANGGPLPVKAAGLDRVTVSAYDKSQQLVSETKVGVSYYSAQAGGAPVKKTGDVVTRYGYDALGRQNTVIDALGGTVYTYYDALGHTVAVAKVQAPGVPEVDGAGTPLTEFKLDIMGNTVYRIDYVNGASGAISGQQYSVSDEAKANADNRVTITSYNPDGHATRVLDAQQYSLGATGASINLSYDVYGRVAKQWRGVTSAGQQQTAFQITRYDALGRIREVETPGQADLVNGGAAQRVRKSNVYNGFGEVINTYVATGNDASQDASNRTVVGYTRYDQAGNAWNSNTADGVDTVRLFDALGRVTAQIRSTGDFQHALAVQGSAMDVLRLPNQLRTETLYDRLGHVIDSTSNNTQLNVLQLKDGVWTLATPAYNQGDNDSLIVIGRREDQGKTATVQYRLLPDGAWSDGAARVQWIDGYPVFSTGGLATGNYEYQVKLAPPNEAAYSAGGGKLFLLSTPSNLKNQKLAALYLMLLGRAPDPSGLNWWMDKYNQGVSLAQIAGGIYSDSEARQRLTGDSSAVVRQLFQSIGQPQASDPDYAAKVALWAGRLAQAGTDPLKLGSVIASLLELSLPALSLRANAVVNYLMQGGGDADVSARLVAAAGSAPDGAIADGTAAARLETQRAQLSRLYLALFSRAPDKEGFDFWANALASGVTPEQVALSMLQGAEANDASLLPSATLSTDQYNDKLVKLAYANLMGRAPSAAELAAAKATLGGTSPNLGQASFVVNLGNQVASYVGSDAASLAARALLFDKITVSLAYATLPSQGDVAQRILVNKAAMAAISSAADAHAAAVQATQLLQTQAQAAAMLVDTTKSAVAATPLENLRLRLAQLYTVVLNRAPDAGGFAFWMETLKNNGLGALPVIAGDMLSQEGSNAALYPATLKDNEFLTRVFNLGLGFPAGTLLTNAVNAWLPRMAGATRGQIIVDIINSLVASNTSTDQPMRNLLSNRAAVGVTYAVNLGASDLATAKSMLALVTDSDIKKALDTATTATAAAAAAIANANLAAITAATTLNNNYVSMAQQSATAQGKLLPAQNAANASPIASPLLRAATLYVTILNRGNTGTPDLDLYGVTAMAQTLQAGASDVDMARNMLNSAEGLALFPTANYNPTQFVTQLYRQALGREPDAGGLAFWVAGAQTLESRAQIAVDLVKGFLNNPVADNNPNKVANLQSQAAFYTRMSAVLTKLSTVADNTAAAQAAANDAAAKATAAVNSAKAVTTAVTNAASTNARSVLEVARLFVGILNRGAATSMPIDIGGLNFWTRARLQGVTLDSIAADFLRSPEGSKLFANATTNQAFISQIYMQVLGRDVAAGDNFWLNVLNGGATRANVAVSIIRSLTEETYQADTEYTTKANFDQRVGDAMKTVSATATAGAKTAADLVTKTAADKAAADKAVPLAKTALDNANALTVEGDAAVIAAVANAPRGSAFLASPNIKALTEVLVAFGRPTDFNTVAAMLQRLATGTTMGQLIAPFVPASMADRQGFFRGLYTTILKRDPDQGGLDWWASTGLTDPGPAAFEFLKGALAELYTPLAGTSKRLNFKGEFDAVNNANLATANAMANGVAPARADAATRIAQARSTAQQNYQDAVDKAATNNYAWQDASSMNPFAQAAPAALTAAVNIQTLAVTADKAMAASLIANAKMQSLSASVGLPTTATPADYTALTTAVANVKKAAVLDATLETALGGIAAADVARTSNVQSPPVVSALTTQVTTITRVYTALLNREPTQIELNSALDSFKAGKSADDLASSLIAANPAIYTAGMSNDAFVAKVFLMAFNRAPDTASLRFWSDPLGGATPLSRGALVNQIILSITVNTFNSDSVTFGQRVAANLVKETTAAKAAVTNVADFITLNTTRANTEAAAYDAAALATKPSLPDVPYASQMTQLYLALLGRAPEASALLAGVMQLKAGTALQTIAQSILDSAEITARMSPAMTDAQFVTAFYTLGLGRPADTAENSAALAKLSAKTPRAQLVLSLINDLYAYAGNDSVKLGARTSFMGEVSLNLDRSTNEVYNYAGMLQTAADRSAVMDKSKLVSAASDGRVVGRDTVTSALAVVATAHITVDRWGNVLSVSDLRDANWKISYQYNYNNQQIDQTLNTLSGTTAVHSSTGYDMLGRQVIATDYRGNSNSQRYDANGNVVQEVHADGGIVSSSYNLFGNRLSVAQPNTVVSGSTRYGVLTKYSYDHLGHVATVSTGSTNLSQLVDVYGATFYDVDGNDKPLYSQLSQLTTTYAYDEMGRAIGVTNADNSASATVYDLDGNVIKTVASYKARGTQMSPRGWADPDEVQTITLNTYDAFHHLIASRDGNGNVMRWDTDSFGRVTRHVDLGGGVITSQYNAAGQMVSQTTVRTVKDPADGSIVQQDQATVRYGYTGTLLTSIDRGDTTRDLHVLGMDSHDVLPTAMLTSYRYDAVGNRISEQQTYQAGNPEAPARAQNNTLSYDMQNRLTGAKDDLYTLTYTYDDNGNRLSIRTDIVGQTPVKPNIVYNAYDSMNRQTVVNGDWAGDAKTGAAVYGAHGHLIAYDLAGNRVSDTYKGLKLSNINGYYNTAKDLETKETYYYDAVGRLTLTQRDGVTIDQRHYDAASRVTESGFLDYVKQSGKNSGVTTSLDSLAQAIGIQSGSTTYHYDDNGRIQRQTLRKLDAGISVDYYYVDDPRLHNVGFSGGYDAAGNLLGYTVVSPDRKWEDYGRYQVTYTAFDSYKEHTQRVDKGEMTISLYDIYGNRTGLNVDAKKTTATFWYDAAGHVQSKVDYTKLDSSGNPKRTFSMIVNDQVLGYEDGDANNILGSTYTGAVSAAQVTTPSAYTVQHDGETLQSIAQTIWGDSKLWYMIADANGINAGDTLKVNQVLNIPIRVNTVHNDYATFKPYDASDAIGNTAPALPPPSHGGGCGVAGKLIMVVVAIAVTYITAGAAANAIFAAAGGAAGTTAAAAAAAGSLTGALSVVAGAAVGGAVGSIASQLVGNAIGAQDGFSWNAVAMSAIGSAATAGAGALGQAAGTESILNGQNWPAVAARAALSNTISQGVGMITGLQHGFNWTSVAASYAGAAVNSQVSKFLDSSDAFKTALGSYAGFTNNALSGFASGVSSSVVRGGRIDVAQIATDAFGNALGSSLADITPQTPATPVKSFSDSIDRGPDWYQDWKARTQDMSIAEIAGIDSSSDAESVGSPREQKKTRTQEEIDYANDWVDKQKGKWHIDDKFQGTEAVRRSLVNVVRDGNTLTLNANVLVGSDDPALARDYAKASQEFWGGKSFTDTDGTIYRTKVRVGVAEDRSKATIWLDKSLPAGSDVTTDWRNSEQNFPTSALYGKPSLVYPHEFAHVALGVWDAYGNVTFPDGATMKGVPRTGFEDSIMANTISGKLRFSDLKGIMLHLEKSQYATRQGK